MAAVKWQVENVGVWSDTRRLLLAKRQLWVWYIFDDVYVVYFKVKRQVSNWNDNNEIHTNEWIRETNDDDWLNDVQTRQCGN